MNWQKKPLPEIRNMLSLTCLPVGETNESPTNQRASAFIHLTEIPWFERVWVIQEVAMAQKTTIMYGRRAVSSSVFSMIPSLIGIELSSHANAILELMPGWLRFQSPSSQDRRLLTLLRRFKDSQSTLEVDRVYAFIGLASDVSNFSIDYNISFQEVVSNIALYLSTGSLSHAISLPTEMFSYSEMLVECQNRENLFEFIFSRGLKFKRADILIPLLDIEPGARQWITVLEDFILNVDSFRTIVDDHFPGQLIVQENDLVQKTLSEVIRLGIFQPPSSDRHTGRETEGIEGVYPPIYILNWTRRMLLLVAVHGDVSIIGNFLESGKYFDTSRYDQAWSQALDVMPRAECAEAQKGSMNHALAKLLIAFGPNYDAPSDSELVELARASASTKIERLKQTQLMELRRASDSIQRERLNELRLIELEIAIARGSAKDAEDCLNGEPGRLYGN
ncbi:heterokaryon incompatibility protein-domain-containing protein [Apiospora marii]|uniref:Heterokaryon incompatibility protein-domain-containing protein n=1 Tax=Apiospora marii TaxID=335849 RepID=A0ABR1SSF6_9PEZI